jgi:thymidylate synthase ThyX
VIEAKVIADSLAPCGARLTTFVVTYPRFILAEVNTHRALSRNSASSRAIPVQKMIERVLNTPATPVSWGKNQKGMQAGENVDLNTETLAVGHWYDALRNAVFYAEQLVELGIHKQIANRILEPFAHMTTIVSATDWENFFALRAHPDAQPEFQALADLMLEKYVEARPRSLQAGEWHLPFADKYVEDGLSQEQLVKITSARCARVSYLNFEGDISYEKDYKLHDDLLASGHMSPFEHAAFALSKPERSGNFVGFCQYRKTLPFENRVCNVYSLLKERKAARP